MARITVPKMESSTFRGWGFVLVAGVLLAFVAVVDRGGLGHDVRSTADGSTGCQLEVTAEELNLRAGPSRETELLDTLTRGDEVDGTPVVTGGYRELEGGRWAMEVFLTPLPGTDCS